MGNIVKKKRVEHTPLPWYRVLEHDEHRNPIFVIRYGSPDDIACWVIGQTASDFEEDEKNTDFMLKACNSHYTLVAALESIEAANEQGNDTDMANAIIKVYAALGSVRETK